MEGKAKKLSATNPVVFTANRLRDGLVVWLAAGDRWVENFADARIFEGDAVAEGRAMAEAWVGRQIVVGVYDVEVETATGHAIPVRYRERVRVSGPSVGTDLNAAAAA
jgi:sulfite reductase (NADPH) hemoprotein beta-component